MKKILLILLCIPLIGLGQNKKELKSIILQKNDSLRLLKEQLLIQENYLSEKIKSQDYSLSNLQKEIVDLKKELSVVSSKSNVLHMNAISYYDDMESRNWENIESRNLGEV